MLILFSSIITLSEEQHQSKPRLGLRRELFLITSLLIFVFLCFLFSYNYDS